MKGRVQLYRLSLFLGYPCRYLKLQFSVVFRNDMGKEASSTFNVGGNDYLRVAPHPYITMDFVSDVDRNEIWSRNKQFRLDRFGKFQFVKRGKELLECFKTNENLFLYEGEKLIVNKEISKKCRKFITTPFQTLMMFPTVVTDIESNKEFEGVCMMINGVDNYSMLTYEEFEFLVDQLERFDMDATALNLIIYERMMRGAKFDKLGGAQFNQQSSFFPDKKPEDIEETSGAPLVKSNEIPNI